MEELTLSLELLSLLFAIGLVAGLVDAIAGGGGLIALPALLATGLSPIQALATNKLQGSFGTFSASLYFVRHGLVNLREIQFMIACTFAGSALGTLLVQNIDAAFLSQFMPLLLILIALYFWLSPTIGDEERRQRIGMHAFALSVGFGTGFYDGFFGPGAGSFFAIGFVGLMGFGLTRATAHTKILNLTSNLASLLFFIASDQVVWSLGITMGIGQLLGARLGANMVLRKGTRLIRPAIVLVCIVVSIKLMLDNSSL
jgi:hypothetical protein